MIPFLSKLQIDFLHSSGRKSIWLTHYPVYQEWGIHGNALRYMITTTERKADLIKPIDNTFLMPYNAPSIPGGLQ